MSNQATPTGYAPDGPPAIFNDPDPARQNAEGATSQTYTVANAAHPKIVTAPTSPGAVPAVGADARTFTPASAPTPFTTGLAAEDAATPA